VEGQLEETNAGRQLALVTERVLVLVDGGPASVRAVRRAATLAVALRATLQAVVVDTPESLRSSFDRQRDLQEAIDDATDLGAQIVRIEAKDVVDGLEQVARSSRATHVVLSQRETGGLQRLRERPLADRILERLPDIEVHLVAAAAKGGRQDTRRP
jgi:two-component system sensor histidine kinase KdpD